MGCASSIGRDNVAGTAAANSREGAASGKAAAPGEEALRLAFEAGYLMPNSSAPPFNTHEDYRGYAVTMSTNASSTKTDVVCRWADVGLAHREKNGGYFFNPQDPYVWPKELLATYAAYFNDQFAPHATHVGVRPQNSGNSGGKRTGSREGAQLLQRTGAIPRSPADGDLGGGAAIAAI